MPRSGPPTYVYSLPPVYLAVPGTTITAGQHNDPFQDIAATFNSVQPVVWGGTGAPNVAGARANLELIPGTDIAGLSTANVFTANQTTRLSNDGATAGPLLTLDRLSASPAANDLLAQMVFSGRDSGGGTQTYGLIGTEIVDPTAASEDGRLFLQSVIAGALATRAYVGSGVYSPNATLGDGGADTINFPTYLLNGVSSFPNGMLYGCTIANNGTDATNDIDFGAGKCADATNASIAVCTAKTKQLDANWAAGTNQGMRYSGAAIANTTYHLYAVWKAGGVDPDWYADPSAVAATALVHLQAEPGGSSYAYVRRVGSVVRTGGAIKPFTQADDLFLWNAAVSDYSAAASTSGANVTLTVPLGIVVTAQLSIGVEVGGGNYNFAYYRVSPLTEANAGASSSNFTVITSKDDATNAAASTWAQVLTDTAGRIRQRGTMAHTLDILTNGYVDTRGRVS